MIQLVLMLYNRTETHNFNTLRTAVPPSLKIKIKIVAHPTLYIYNSKSKTSKSMLHDKVKVKYNQ